MGMWVGRGRKARAAYGFDDIALVPGALTINPNEVDISWDLCGRRFDIPIIAAAMDGVVSPSLAIEMGRLGGLAVINLEGIFSRYENPDAVLDRITSASLEEATKIIQGIYGEPIKEELIHKRISEIKKGGGPVMVSSIPQRAVVGGAAADDHRDVERGDELLQVQGRAVRRDVLGRDDRPLDDEDVEPRLDCHLVVLAHFLRRQRAAGNGAAGLDFLDPPGDQLRLHRLGVDLLHQPRRFVLGRGGDRLQPLLGVLEARPDPLQVQDPEAAELVGQDGGLG